MTENTDGNSTGKNTNEQAQQLRDQLKGANFGAASFAKLVQGLAAEAAIHLGMLPSPLTKQKSVQLDAAKFSIDLLGIMQDKTRGNLTDDERRQLDGALYELRMAYVQVAGKKA